VPEALAINRLLAALLERHELTGTNRPPAWMALLSHMKARSSKCTRSSLTVKGIGVAQTMSARRGSAVVAESEPAYERARLSLTWAVTAA
jgi:hypothetical protein